MEHMNIKKMPFIKFGMYIILTTVIIVFVLLHILHINKVPLLSMIIEYFTHTNGG